MKDELADIRKLDLPFKVDDVISQCHGCVRDQLKKYEHFVDTEGSAAKNKFSIPCEGIKKHIIDPVQAAALSDEELQHYEATQDVVQFASTFLKLPTGDFWKARWYQEQVLRCTSRKKVLRISRRTGKCISQRSHVLTAEGPIKASEFYSLKTKPQVISFDENDQSLKLAFADIKENGVQPVFNLLTKNSRETEVTDNHPFLVQTSPDSAEWRELKDLEVGDKIAVPSTYQDLIKGVSVGARKARLLGYLTGDGGTSYKITVRFTNFDQEIVDDLQDILSDYDCELNSIAEGNYNVVGSGEYYMRRGKNKVNKIVTEEGLRSLAVDKRVPSSIMNGTLIDVANFLGAYWDCDGWASVGKKCWNNKKYPNVEIGACSASKGLAQDIQYLLLRFGIFSNLKKKNVKYKNGYNIAWQLTMAGKESIEKFRNYIPLIAKQSKVEEVWEVAKYRKARRIKEDYFWDVVKSIKYSGQQMTYDLTVPETHTLITDGIISHNTDSVCIDIVYNLFVKEKHKLIVCGPQKTHVDEIFTRVRAFIKSNPMFRDSIERDVSAPYYELRLKNGSRLRGYAAGTKGKKEGIGVRGQDADIIYIEEMDYVDANAIVGAIYPILQTSPNTSLIGFSTPSGFKTPYRTLCEDNPQYKEFHYSYKVLPWYKQVEADRVNYTIEEWEHEFLALFGDAEAGVYKPSYIERAMADYEYHTQVRNPIWKYAIGTDWNEKHGTEIVVLGFNPLNGGFQIVEAQLIEKSEFTQLRGVERLLELNRKWRPSFIYIDAGGGSTNYELLRQTAYENSTRDGDRATANLLTILKKYDSGASLTIKDPITRQKRKAPAKSFMVNASVRMFEQNKIRVSSYDNVLEKQLRNYIIDRITPTKAIVYGLAEPRVLDHRLDALNLAIVAFHLELDNLHVANIMTSVGIIPSASPQNTEEQSDKRDKLESPTSAHHGPEDRRLEGFEKTWAEKSVFQASPGVLNDPLQGIKTNRPGWATDEEDKHIAKFLQRRRNRRNVNKPSRTNF